MESWESEVGTRRFPSYLTSPISYIISHRHVKEVTMERFLYIHFLPPLPFKSFSVKESIYPTQEFLVFVILLALWSSSWDLRIVFNQKQIYSSGIDLGKIHEPICRGGRWMNNLWYLWYWHRTPISCIGSAINIGLGFGYIVHKETEWFSWNKLEETRRSKLKALVRIHDTRMGMGMRPILSWVG